MKNRPEKRERISREERLVEALRERPELMERFESILALTDSASGELRTADQIEGLLVEEMRRLGNGAMHQWAKGAEERTSQELGEVHPRVRIRKKKS